MIDLLITLIFKSNHYEYNWLWNVLMYVKKKGDLLYGYAVMAAGIKSFN